MIPVHIVPNIHDQLLYFVERLDLPRRVGSVPRHFCTGLDSRYNLISPLITEFGVKADFGMLIDFPVLIMSHQMFTTPTPGLKQVHIASKTKKCATLKIPSTPFIIIDNPKNITLTQTRPTCWAKRWVPQANNPTLT
jgi:hypothetical protein